MTTLTIEVDNNAIKYISNKHRDINAYLWKLIKEDMLLNEINDSKKSWINTLNSLDNLDN